MVGAVDRAGYRACALPGRGLTLEYSKAALEEILDAAIEGFLAFPYGGVEVGGVLFGTAQGRVLRVVTSLPVACEHAFGPGYTLSQKDESGLRELLLNYTNEPALAGLVPLGWYHTHTRGGLTLSSADREVHDRHFRDRWQVAMVLQPRYSKPTHIGIFLREPDGNLPEAPSYQFEIAVVPVAGPRALQRKKPPTEELAAEPAAAEAAVLAETAPEADAGAASLVAEDLPARPKKWRWTWVWMILAGCLLLLGASLFVPGLWRQAPAPVVLALRLAESDGRLDIHWDAAAPAVRQAQRGWLEISDGPTNVLVPLDPKRLGAGSWSMARQTPEVRVRLRVQGPGAVPYEESAHFVGPPPGASSPPPEAAPAAREPVRGEPVKPRAEPESRQATAVTASKSKPPPRRVFVAPRIAARQLRAEVPKPPEIPQSQSLPRSAPIQTGRLPEALVAPPPAPAPAVETAKPAPAPAVETAKPAPAYRGPQAGKLIWTGFLPQNSVLTIENRRPTTGHLNGELPPVPFRVGASPADFAGGGLTVYSADPRFMRGPVTEPPGPQNGWNRTVYRYEPRLAQDLVVIEAPSAQNGWDRLVLRSGERALSVIVIEWGIIP